LQAQIGSGEQQPQGGFLDSMRDAVLGRRDQRGSVPNVRTQASQPSSAPYQSQAGYPPQAPPILRVRAWLRAWLRAWARPLNRADRFSARL
jgi:hypothetical protein